MLTIKIKAYVCYSQNLQKQYPKIFQTEARVPGAPVLDPPLALAQLDLCLFLNV